MNVIVYGRPGLTDWFRDVLLQTKKLFKYDFTACYYSEHKLKGSTWLPGTLDEKSLQNTNFYARINDIDYDDVITRCRLLRNIDEKQAIYEVNKYVAIWEYIFEVGQPELVISITIDSYIIDILERVACKKEITFLGFTGCFLNNYYRLSSRGEYNTERVVSDEEVERVFKDIYQPDYLPNFMWRGNTVYQFIKRWFTLKVKKTILMYKLIGDRGNYDYRTVLYKYSADVHSLSHYYCRFDKVSELKREGKKICYIPLHFYPEATVDYWTKALGLVNYYASLKLLISSIEAANLFDYIIIKEHPGAVFTRKGSFYDDLKAFQTVKLLSPSTSSSDVLDMSQCVISWTGTVCFEAALKGKPAFLLGAPFFFLDKYMNQFDSIKDLIIAIKNSSYSTGCQTTSERKELVRFVLQSCLPGSFLQKNYLEQANVEKVAISLTSALEARAHHSSKRSGSCVE